MKRYQLGSLVVALGLLASPLLHGQTQPTEGIRFGVGGGLTLPTGNYGDVDKAGWHVMGLIQLPISESPVHLRFDAMYGQTSHKGGGSGSTTLTGATADLLYHLGNHASTVRPYVLGGLGFYNVDGGGGSGSSTKFAFGLGGGILFSVGTMHAFLEGRYMSIQANGSSFPFVPITLGVMFGN